MGLPHERLSEYGKDSVVKNLHTEEYVLLVGIGSRQFELPRINVGSDEVPVSIFKVDLRPEHDRDLYEAAAEWYADQFMLDNIRILVIPHSTKSTQCLLHAVEMVNKRVLKTDDPYTIRVIQLVGGKSPADIEGCEYTQQYEPITVAPGEHKYMGIMEDDVEFLQSLFVPNNEELLFHRQHEALVNGIAIGDDVLSSGKTLAAIDNLLNDVTQGSLSSRVYVFARESEEPFTPLAERTKAAISIPVIIGDLSKAS